MLTFNSALALSLFLGGIVIFFLANRWRISKFENFQLTPNCLITRHPVLFLEGQPSFFYFFNYWNLLPTYLKEHGYEVFELPYGGYNQEARRQTLEDFLVSSHQKGMKFHLISDSSLKEDALWAHEKLPNIVPSVTTIVGPQESWPTRVADLTPNKHYHVKLDEKNPSFSLWSFFWRAVLSAHKLYTRKPKHWDPRVLGLPLEDNQEFRKTLLEHLIFLAESDLQCSH